MKLIRFLFHFLGSLPFALFLIASVILFVIAGTFLESWSDSHLLASRFTYGNPVFKGLLWGFFINILFAALRRIPFQTKHIPFLLTHLGLLMLLAGTLIKSYFGVQGTMSLIEGCESHYLQFPSTYAICIESPQNSYSIPVNYGDLGKIDSPFESLEVTILEWLPHTKIHFEQWIKKGALQLVGYPPLVVVKDSQSGSYPLLLKSSGWHIYAGQTDHPPTTIEKSLFELPTIIFLQDKDKNEHVFALNEKGEKNSKVFNFNELDAILAFNKGYGGYALPLDLPLCSHLELITPLRREIISASLPLKKEEQIPALRLLLTSPQKQEIVVCPYDRFLNQLKWPILEGKYLLRFQPEQQSSPHRVRLREAKQISYPHTSQPLSYEGKLLIDEKEVTLSMNHVYETSKGYRFYLSNLIQPSSTSAKRVLLAVNRDPAKRFLTYPGAIILALGMLLVFWPKKGKFL